jgi:hypothetical protein
VRRLFRLRPGYILLLIIELLYFSIFPQPAQAWSAVVDNSWLLRAGSWLVERLTGNWFESNQDLGSHQLMIRLACERLARDPAWQDQKDFFPDKDGILGWEGVVIDNVPQGVVSGGKWTDPKRGGPDADGKTKDSLHYYNPLANKGGAPTAVQDCFNNLLLQLYNQGNFSGKSPPNDDTNHFAAWSAHYLADVSVPYHTVGIPNSELRDTLSPAEAGPDYLYKPAEARLDESETIIPESVTAPDEWRGQDGNFADIVSYFKVVRGSNDLKDWFDPWYYNGRHVGLGSNPVIGSASHGSWEAWAHKYIVMKKLYVSPAEYSKEWINAAPGFGSAIRNLEAQAAQAKYFTIAAAAETRKNIALFTKEPQWAFNKAIERMATLWRASLTALRPGIQVIPDPGNPKLLKVLATIQSVEPADHAKNVQAKLTADGGKVRGSDTQPWKADITPGNPGILSWNVDAADPDSCKLRLEVICTYQNTPDLQYAVAEPSQNRVTIDLSPNQVHAGDKVKLTVKVQPPGRTQLTITDWGPLQKESPDITTDSSGTYSREYTVSKSAKDARYSVKIQAGKLDVTRSADINVGLNIKNSRGIYIRFLYNNTATFVSSGRTGKPYTGYLMGDNPQCTITGWDGDYTINATMVGTPNETGKLRVTLDSNYETVTGFTWEYSYQNGQAQRGDPRSVTTTITGGGLKRGELVSPIARYTPDFYYKLIGDTVCGNMKVKMTKLSSDGTTEVLQGVSCNPNTITDFLFQR